jgi:hypothetical protein
MFPIRSEEQWGHGLSVRALGPEFNLEYFGKKQKRKKKWRATAESFDSI